MITSQTPRNDKWAIDCIKTMGAAAIIIGVVAPSPAWAQSSNAQYGTFDWGSYVVQNEIYNPPSGGYNPNNSNNTQSIWSENGGWGSTWNWTNISGGGPASFPSAYIGWYFGGNSPGSGGFPVKVSSVNNGSDMMPTSVDYQVQGNEYDVAYDFFLDTNKSPGNSNPTIEMMVWLTSNGGASPAGSQIFSNITLGNESGTYNVYYSAAGETAAWPIITYVANSQTTNINMYLQPFVWWALNKTNWISSSDYVVGVAFGAEPHNGSGSIYVTSYSASASGTD